jgi:hypothetical protein
MRPVQITERRAQRAANETGETLVIVQRVGFNKHRRLCSWIRESLCVALGDQRLPGHRDLDEELVVTHQGDDLLAAVEDLLAEHLACVNAREVAQLIEKEPDRRFGCGYAAALESASWRWALACLSSEGM